jgi:hypothetical protein
MGRRVITEREIQRFSSPGRYIESIGPGVTADLAGSSTVPGTGAVGPDGTPPVDDYLSQVVKYIPAEIVAGFLTLNGILASASKTPQAAYWIVFGLLILLTPLYIWRVTKDPKLPMPWVQIVVATGSFIIWVFAIGGPFTFLNWYLPVYGAITLPIYTLGIPIVVGRPRSVGQKSIIR